MCAKLMDQYQRLYGEYSETHQKIRRRINLIALLRTITFLAGAYFGYQIFGIDSLAGFIFTGFMLVLFVWLVVRYNYLRRRLSLVESLVRLNANEIEALRGNVKSFENGFEFQDASHAYASDLEIFGDNSLFQHINRTSTYSGKNQLASWLLNPLAGREAIESRQQAVHELRERLSWRQHFTATGYQVRPEDDQDARLVAWSKERPAAGGRLVYRIIRWILPLVTMALMVLFFTGLLPVGYLLLVLVVNLLVLRRVSGVVTSQHQQVTKQISLLRNYSRLFRHIENSSYESNELEQLKAMLTSEHQPASKSIRSLSRITDALDNRFNPIVGIVLNLVFLWDIHQVIRLEQWHRHHASHIEQWLLALGSFDALISLANFSYNNEDFNFPHISDAAILSTSNMGHPLIPQTKRVTNDLSIDKAGSTMIVTGANMAGKSTFLRTIGVNLVLAMAGSVVCARDMHFKITRIFSSMNITDSLSKNESYFYAEIKRLKQLTDQAMKQQPLLVLLDEILTGTNTHDKEKASKAFVRRLLTMKITSVIATHDLSLTSLANEYPQHIRNTSFEVELENGRMRYDYRLREGVAKNMNALALLREIKLI